MLGRWKLLAMTASRAHGHRGLNKRKRRINPQIKKINTDEKRRKFLARRRGKEERLLRRCAPRNDSVAGGRV